MSKLYFHFTLGPVQGFVAQARRTRDFWAGSFILSWLSAVAMKEVQQQAGMDSILFPKPDPAFLLAMEKGKIGPRQGSIPNRFKAKVDSDFDPARVETAVRMAWKELEEHVWVKDLVPVSPKQETRDIWERQVKSFWEIAWAMTPDEKDSSVLARIKNWRIHYPPDEPGVKCMMMEGWQELSGAARPGQEGKAFWNSLLQSDKNGMKTDLREGEQLCAIAFIKRRFTRHFQDLRPIKMPGGWELNGWGLPSGMPSTPYMAAAPWLARLIAQAQSDPGLSNAMWEFHDLAYQLTGSYGEWDSNIACVTKAHGATSEKKWRALDGAVYFDAMLENSRLWGGKSKEAQELLQKLKKLRKLVDQEPVSPFYAVLLMDGDQLGIHMGDLQKQAHISDALASFTCKAEEIVERNSGALVYAGGDDVLALLPLEYAMNCAWELRQYYMASFVGCGFPASISAAIEYAHIKMPLGKILGDAHDLLDNVAKKQYGRDSLACRVWKPGGQALEWGMPWEVAVEGNRVEIDRLAEEFRSRDSKEDGAGMMSSNFFFRIRERFEILNPASGKRPVLDPDQAIDLMAMELLNSGTVREKGFSMEQAREWIKPLLKQCRPVIRETGKNRDQWKRDECLYADAALLVRFLACKGIER